jgi:hypothetical protein
MKVYALEIYWYGDFNPTIHGIFSSIENAENAYKKCVENKPDQKKDMYATTEYNIDEVKI